jgi:hypothetical protein
MLIRLSSKGLPRFCEQKHRTRGVHLSSLIQDLFYDNDSIPDQELLTLGRLVEDSIWRNYQIEQPNEYLHEVEIEWQGIYGTLDFFKLDAMRIKDVKFTFRSSKGPEVGEGEIAPPDHPIYHDKFKANLVQICCYCSMWDMSFDGPTQGILQLIHARGDYTAMKVHPREWDVDFEPEEKEMIWNMIHNHAVANYCFTCGEKKIVCKGECK